MPETFAKGLLFMAQFLAMPAMILTKIKRNLDEDNEG